VEINEEYEERRTEETKRQRRGEEKSRFIGALINESTTP
jgi:hypothetical protein